jgi:hypothetical protein
MFRAQRARGASLFRAYVLLDHLAHHDNGARHVATPFWLSSLTKLHSSSIERA